ACFLGVAVGEELHGTLEIGEQHGHLFALAFEGALGGEDLLREMLGRVGFRGGESRCRCGLTTQRLPAGSAELPAGVDSCAARRAGNVQLGATLLAEGDAGPIVEATLRAEHQASPLFSDSACSSQNCMSISRYMVAAIVRCSWATWR